MLEQKPFASSNNNVGVSRHACFIAMDSWLYRNGRCQKQDRPVSRPSAACAVNFGSTGVGKKISHPASVTNTGTTTVTLTQAVVSSTDFSISGLQFPLAIQAGQKANFTVWFKGNKAGKSKGQLNFKGDSDAPDPWTSPERRKAPSQCWTYVLKP